MAKRNEEKSEGLEIISIGKLYSGQWDKKYWSSSRGKDRYPYPIGYIAQRTQNGVTYKMGIHEGLNGPLFTISSTDGQSCSGQTPDIAWDSIQKRGCQIKLLHGKRFSCKIDGVEFFGFKNTFVQRLLRELVTNISGTPEQNFSSSNSRRNETSEAVSGTENASKTVPNLLAHFAIPQVTGKRNRKGRTNNVKSAANSSLKKPRRQKENCNNKDLNPDQQEYGEHPPPISVNKGSCNSSEALQGSESLHPVIEREKVLVPIVESLDKEDHMKVDSLSSQGETKHLNPETEGPLEVSTVLLKDGEPVSVLTLPFRLDRSKVLEEQPIKNQMTEEKDEELPAKNQAQITNDANLWAPDTLDQPSDDSFNLTAEIVKDGVAAVTTVLPDSLQKDSHPESEMDNSERSESDSVGYEIANSMMTVLLPRALPLLRTYTRKKKKSPEISIQNSQDENKKIDLYLDSTSVGELDENSLHRQKNTTFPVRDSAPSSTACSLAECVVPDSYDIAEGGYTPSQGLPQILQVAEAPKVDQTVRDLQTCRPEIEGPSKNDNLEVKLSVCKGETGVERENDFLPSTQKFVQVSKKEISGTKRIGAIVSRGLTQIPPSSEPIVQRVSLSESIICRDFRDDSVPETSADINAMDTSHFLQGSSSRKHQIEQSISANESHIEGWPLTFHSKERFTSTSGVPSNMASRSQDKEIDWMLNHVQASEFLDPTANKSEGKLVEKLPRDQNFVRFTGTLFHKQNQKLNLSADTTEKMKNNENVNMERQKDLKAESEQSGVLKLIAGYAHPMPVSSVLLSTQENDLYICVLCGQPLHEDRTVFMYKAPLAGEERGCPSLIGHVLISFLFSEHAFGGDIELDTAAVQLTPIGQSLVLFNSVKAPSCREGDIKCQCSACASNPFEENAVKIVQIRNSYVSLITKLKTTQRVCCILVCPPDHLVAVDESGKLYIWVMNSKWSAETEECCLLPPDCAPFSSMKLERVPNFASLVVGYNSFGEFNLWDINKRMLVSKSSAASTSIFRCLPVGLFRWQRKFIVSAGVTEETITEITDATRLSFLEMSENQPLCSLEDKDVAIWLLISTAPDPNQPAYQSNEQQSDPIHWWRLALLVNNTMITGSSLDPRASAIGFSAGYGIIGRSDGLVYLWELTTGRKLQNLHHFKGAAVTCIATDDSSHRAVAIGSDGGQLLVYLRS